ncbi:Apolipoprotein N-acyltransferase [uncultured Desulfobacterium sp.]|uniref:Apolipoprotein N-acyltransferase n=1 Tax=uncultured Desulfobacterium sp. TaxID=201089 RepID=A0A445MZX1_9BACT|nr:Apolipoprotein N-acyltransferase [uncultured Desulfobacterium sp.]
MNKSYKNLTKYQKGIAFSLPGIFLAIASGLLLTLSFPPVDLSFIAWFALIPLFKCLEDQAPAQAFRLGFIAGAVHYLTLVYWIVVVLGRYGNLNIVVSTIICLLLCLYMALYVATFSYFIPFLKKSYFFTLFTGSLWVGLEYIRAMFLTGFPWCLLGYTQYSHLSIIQSSDIFGVYGLSFLIVLVNGLAYGVICRLFKRSSRQINRGALKWEAPIITLMIIAALAYGHYRLAGQRRHHVGQPVRAAIIQGNIDQSLKWDPAYQAATVALYQRLTRSVNDFRPELIVWPETAVPFFFQDGDVLSQEVVSTAKESASALIFGSPAYKQTGDAVDYYNRAYLICAENDIKYYDKVHLVPFGEYVPLKRLLFFINRLVPAAGDFAQGDEVATLRCDRMAIGVLICFEAIFPEVARAHARNGANLLVTITNDAWFGKTSAPYQHLAMSVFRAVENRMPMIRAANTGFSAYIGPDGSIISRGDLFTEEVLEASLNISEKPPSFYARFGDVFALSLLAVSFAKCLVCLMRRKQGLRTL